jgi:hypothetical protein
MVMAVEMAQTWSRFIAEPMVAAYLMLPMRQMRSTGRARRKYKMLRQARQMRRAKRMLWWTARTSTGAWAIHGMPKPRMWTATWAW